jgi:hypothetical protein
MPEDFEEDWNLIRPGRAKPAAAKARKRRTTQVRRVEVGSIETSTIWVGFFYEGREVGGFRVPIQLPDPRIDGNHKDFFLVELVFTPRESIFIDEFRLFLSESRGPYFSSYRGAIDSGNNHHAPNTTGLRVSFRLREDGHFTGVVISNRVPKSRSVMVESDEDDDENYIPF